MFHLVTKWSMQVTSLVSFTWSPTMMKLHTWIPLISLFLGAKIIHFFQMPQKLMKWSLTTETNIGTNHFSLYIDGKAIQQVAECKYLWIVIDNKLKWDSNSKVIQGIGNQCMYFLRTMKALHVTIVTMFLFYQCVIQSVICFCCLAWFNSLYNMKKKANLNRIVKHASRVTGVSVKELDDVTERALLAKLIMIVKDYNHPLHTEVVFKVEIQRKSQICQLTYH